MRARRTRLLATNHVRALAAMESLEVPPEEDEPIWSSAVPAEDSTTDPSRDAYYSILNLARDASADDIQKSYKRLAGSCSFMSGIKYCSPGPCEQRSCTRTATPIHSTRPPRTARSRRSRKHTRSSWTRSSALCMTRWERKGSRRAGRSARAGRRATRSALPARGGSGSPVRSH